MKIGLRQQRILEAIIAYYEKEGFLPSYEELTELTDLKSVSTIHYHMNHLIEKGFLIKVDGKSRAYKIVYNAKGEPYHFETLEEKNIVSIPVITSTMTGSQIFDKENITAYLYLPEQMLGAKEGFALKVSGDEMVSEGVLSGDYLLFVESQEAKDQDLIIVLGGNEIACAKYHYHHGEESISFFNTRETIYGDSAMMIGRVVALYRDYKGSEPHA